MYMLERKVEVGNQMRSQEHQPAEPVSEVRSSLALILRRRGARNGMNYRVGRVLSKHANLSRNRDPYGFLAYEGIKVDDGACSWEIGDIVPETAPMHRQSTASFYPRRPIL